MDREFFIGVADRYTVAMEDAFKGWIILLNGRVYITDSHIIFHETREDAIRRFYNDMRWRFRRAVYDRFGNGQNTTVLWNRFKKEVNFEVKRV
jgi:hypothetical protein